jgi:hypothetical protein
MTTMEYAGALGVADNPLFATNLIDTTFESGDIEQYKRELVTNSLEAGATKIYLTAHRLEPYGPEGGVKAAFVDNGKGMTGDKIASYLAALGSGEKDISRSGNFNMGARVSTLPPNHQGVIIASWVAGDEEGSMVHLAYDDESATYRPVAQNAEDEPEAAVGIPLSSMKHPIIAETGHGTVVFLLGSAIGDHTVGRITRDKSEGFIYPETRETVHDLHYLNSKYFRLPVDVELKAMWSNKYVSTEWMQKISPGDWFPYNERTLGESWTHKPAHGLSYILDRNCRNAYGQNVKNKWDKGYSGIIRVCDSKGYEASVHWALFPESNFTRKTAKGGGDSSKRDYNIPLGLFGELYHDELYNLISDDDGGRLRSIMEYYGISRTDIRDRIVIVVEPDTSSTASLEAMPNAARSKLERGNTDLPHAQWGSHFATQMPSPIADRLKFLDATDESTTENVKRLRDRLNRFFSHRQSSRQGENAPIVQKKDDNGIDGGPDGDDVVRTPEKPDTDHPNKEPPGGVLPSRKTKSRDHPHVGGGVKNTDDGPTRQVNGRSREVKICWDHDSREFGEDMSGFLAHWDRSNREVKINGGHPYLKELIHSEVFDRSEGKQSDAKVLAQRAVETYVAAHIIAVETARTSTLCRDGNGIRNVDFTKRALSDESLTAALLNEPSVRMMITNAYKGRSGFSRKEVK